MLRAALRYRNCSGSFVHKGLEELWRFGNSAAVPPNLTARLLRRLDLLNAAEDLSQLATSPGLGLHRLRGSGRYAIAVNGPWRITFEWEKPNALRVDLEQYH
jgi:toxin HigB-1